MDDESRDTEGNVTPIGNVMARLTTAPEGEELPDPITCNVCHEWGDYAFILGEWRSPFDDDGVCDKCKEKQERAEEEKRKAEEIKKRETYRKDNIVELLGRAGVPTMYQDKTLRNFKQIDEARKRVFTVASNYVQALRARKFKNEFGLFLGGARGVGKTHIAAAITREAILAGIPSRFENFPRALLKIKKTFGSNDGPDEADLIQRTSSSPFLVLDDIGKETLSSWARTTTYLIINEREFEGLPFVITSNLFLDEIAEQYDDAIASRIDGTCRIIELDRETPDFRARKGDDDDRIKRG